MKVKNYCPEPKPPSPHNFFDIPMFSKQKEIKDVDKDKDKDKKVIYFWFSLLQKVKGSGSLNKLDVLVSSLNPHPVSLYNV